MHKYCTERYINGIKEKFPEGILEQRVNCKLKERTEKSLKFSCLTIQWKIKMRFAVQAITRNNSTNEYHFEFPKPSLTFREGSKNYT
jgi:hypothetical protein